VSGASPCNVAAFLLVSGVWEEGGEWREVSEECVSGASPCNVAAFLLMYQHMVYECMSV
jgi:hypothetical protein